MAECHEDAKKKGFRYEDDTKRIQNKKGFILMCNISKTFLMCNISKTCCFINQLILCSRIKREGGRMYIHIYINLWQDIQEASE